MSEINKDRKAALQNTIQSASDSIERQIGGYKSIGKNALIIGGIVLGGYALSRIFSSNDKEDDDDEAILPQPKKEESSFVGAAIKGMATTLILTLIKDKLLDFIEQQTNRNEP
jgi:hypothetical protein